MEKEKREEWWEAYIFNEWLNVLTEKQLELLIENIKYILKTNKRREE